jgi:hypothetical protein
MSRLATTFDTYSIVIVIAIAARKVWWSIEVEEFLSAKSSKAELVMPMQSQIPIKSKTKKFQSV